MTTEPFNISSQLSESPSTLSEPPPSKEGVSANGALRGNAARTTALKTSALPLYSLYQHNRHILKDLIDSVTCAPGPKIIIFDKALIGPIGLMVEAKDLKQWGVAGWYELSAQPVDCAAAAALLTTGANGTPVPSNETLFSAAARQSDNSTPARLRVIILLRSLSQKAISYAARQIRDGQRNLSLYHQYVLAVVPRPTEEMLTLFSHQTQPGFDMASDMLVVPCPLYLFPLDTDVVSLELYDAYRAFHEASDPTLLLTCAEALMQLQTLLKGLLPQIWAVGNAAKFVCDQLLRYRRELQMQLPVPTLEPSPALFSDSALSVSGFGPVAGLPPLHMFAPPFRKTDPKSEGNTCFSCSTSSEAYTQSSGPATSGDNAPRSKSVADTNHVGASSCVPDPYNQLYEPLDDVILIDRRVDLVTPFCTCFTYEALLDLVVGIHQSMVKKAVAPSQPGAKAAPQVSRVPLNSSDPVFAEIRDLPQGRVGALLHEKASEVQKTYQEKESLTSIGEINAFMKRFKAKQSEHAAISLHVNLLTTISQVLKSDIFRGYLKLEDDIMSSANISASAMMEMITRIEDAVENEDTPHEAYRLLCLLSNVGNGLTSKALDSLTRTITQTFGVEELLRIHAMEQAGLLRCDASTKKKWTELEKGLHLIVEDSTGSHTASQRSAAQPSSGIPPDVDDISYVCSGYAPLSVRLVELLHKNPNGWRGSPRIFDNLWGPTVEVRQAPLICGGQHRSDNASATTQTQRDDAQGAPPRSSPSPSSGITIVFFLGGCTYAEISAIRLLGKESGRRYIIFTTEILNYKKFIESFTPAAPLY